MTLSLLLAPTQPDGGGTGPDDDHYFTIAELRATDEQLGDTVKHPAAALEEARELAESSIEDAAGVAFLTRETTEFARAVGRRIFLLRPRVQEILSAETVDHPPVVTVDVAGGQVVYSQTVLLPVDWPRGTLRVTYRHGYLKPPPRVKHAALILAKTWRLEGPVSDRATQYVGLEGGAINLATPGLLGSTFGIPEVDAVVKQYGAQFVPIV